MNLSESLATIQRLSKLPENWDSYGSKPIDFRAVVVANALTTLLDHLNAPDVHICPVNGGGIQFEWDGADRDLEIEIKADGTLEYAAFLTSDDDFVGEGAITLSDVPKLLAWLDGAPFLDAAIL